MMLLRFILLVLTLSTAFSGYAKSQLSFHEYIKELESKLIKNGSNAYKTKEAFHQVKLFKKAVVVQEQTQQRQPTLDTYIPEVVNEQRVKKARTLYKTHLPLLKEIERKYNIQPRFIIALWGVSSDFADEIDGYNALSVLSSLAYTNPNDKTYYTEIESVVNLLNSNDVGLSGIKSDRSGKVGLFSLSAQQYSSSHQDYDNDGKSDIWRSMGDSFATTAKYLADNGWENDFTWGRQVKLPKNFDNRLIAKDEYLTLSQWKKIGLTRFDDRDLPNAQLKAKITAPDGANGRVYLTYKNFEYLMKLNDSLYNSIAVGYLSNRIKFPPIK